MKEHFGLKGIDALWISHMHGDHFLHARILKEKYGAKTWTLDRIADKCENPRRYDYAALVSAYGDGFDGVPIDKPFKNGESVEWEGYKIQVDWMPGQTEFGCCLWLEIDGKKIAFTGDNLFADSSNPEQNGHEAVVARNSSIRAICWGAIARSCPRHRDGSPFLRHARANRLLHRYHEWSKKSSATKIYCPSPTTSTSTTPTEYRPTLPGRLFGKRDPVRQITVRNFRSTNNPRNCSRYAAGITADHPFCRKPPPSSEQLIGPSPHGTAEAKRFGIIPFDITWTASERGNVDFIYRTDAENDGQ